MHPNFFVEQGVLLVNAMPVAHFYESRDGSAYSHRSLGARRHNHLAEWTFSIESGLRLLRQMPGVRLRRVKSMIDTQFSRLKLSSAACSMRQDGPRAVRPLNVAHTLSVPVYTSPTTQVNAFSRPTASADYAGMQLTSRSS